MRSRNRRHLRLGGIRDVQNYLITGEERWLTDKPGPGLLVLDDGSLWQVSPQHLKEIESWVRFSSISVQCDYGSATAYRYTLINTSYDRMATARYMSAGANSAARRSA